MAEGTDRQRTGDDAPRDDPAVAVRVVRSGGFAGLRRTWAVDVDAADAGPWIALVEACPWDGCRSAEGASGADRFSYRLSARMRGAERQADLAESDAVGPWRALIDAVREASLREASVRENTVREASD